MHQALDALSRLASYGIGNTPHKEKLRVQVIAIGYKIVNTTNTIFAFENYAGKLTNFLTNTGGTDATTATSKELIITQPADKYFQTVATKWSDENEIYA